MPLLIRIDYRAMHYSAKRVNAIACRQSVMSLRLSVCLSVTLVDQDHISWKSLETKLNCMAN